MKTPNSRRFASLLVAASLAAPAYATSDYLLELDGIPGETSVVGKKSVIELESFTVGASTTVVSGGAGAGKVSFTDIAFTKPIDKTSPLLYLNCANGKVIKKATLFVRKLGSTTAGSAPVPTDYYTITLSDVLVTSIQTSGRGRDVSVPNESFSLNFGKIEFNYLPQKADGTFEAAVKSGWDTVRNVVIAP
jgi:type VI secretion system secreted protein Hcp